MTQGVLAAPAAVFLNNRKMRLHAFDSFIGHYVARLKLRNINVVWQADEFASRVVEEKQGVVEIGNCN